MTIATVIFITGQAWARDADGNLRELRVGDTLQEGETLVTDDNARVQLDFGDGLDPTFIEGGQQVAMTPELDNQQPVAAEDFSALDEDLEALLAAIDEGEGDLLDALDATAAGAGPGGGADGGHSFVMLGRIAEDVLSLNFDYGMGQLAAIDFPEDVAELGIDPEETAIEVDPEEDEPVDGAPEAGASAAELFDAQLLQEGGSIFTGTLAFDYGPDGVGSIGFAGMDGTTGQVGTETATYSWNAATNTLTATGPRGELFSLVVNPITGEYTLTLLDNVLHAEGTDEAGLELTFTAFDGNGTPADGTLSVTITDDVPVANPVVVETLTSGDTATGNV
ncbi:retention module-containing protein, partial [Halomonas sp. RA08-2]|uniref:retention module-containing protein n=1 Tax=Halomonas sp. RA08-2 TaxID=3440842 RepID=UPI003EEA3F2A